MRWRKMKGVWLGVVMAVPCVFAVAMHSVALRHRGLRPGELLPVARLRSPDGGTVTTEAWRGRPTLLVLFRPACQACKAEIRSLSEAVLSLDGIRVVLVSVDSTPAEFESPFPVYVDPEGTFLRRTQRLLVPTLYYLDADGRVVYTRMGRPGRNEPPGIVR